MSQTDPTPDAARLDRLFAEHARAVVAYAMRRTGSSADAEDIAAETFMIAWRKLDAIPADARPWLYAVARRVVANHRRGRGRRERLASLLRVEDVPTPMRLGDDLDGPTFEALASLSPSDQELLRLVAWEGLTNQAIASVLGISPNAVAIRLHRARTRFARALGRPHGPTEVKGSGWTRTSTDVTGTHGAGWKGVGK